MIDELESAYQNQYDSLMALAEAGRADGDNEPDDVAPVEEVDYGNA